MSDKSTYQRIRESRCPHCAAGIEIAVGVFGAPPMHWSVLSQEAKRCTAPTAEQVIEEQAARIAELEHDKARLVEALKAMVCVMDRGPQPKKLDEALSWRECDEKARELADAAIDAAMSEAKR